MSQVDRLSFNHCKQSCLNVGSSGKAMHFFLRQECLPVTLGIISMQFTTNPADKRVAEAENSSVTTGSKYKQTQKAPVGRLLVAGVDTGPPPAW
jgi:hypothetical protein